MKREPLLTADTVKPELFNMKAFIARVNAHANMAKLEKEVSTAEIACGTEARDRSLSHYGMPGKTIAAAEKTFDGGLLIVFTDGMFIKLVDGREFDSYGVDAAYPEIDELVRFGIVQKELVDKLNEAKEKLSAAQKAAKVMNNSYADLREAVNHLGKDTVKAIIDTF